MNRLVMTLLTIAGASSCTPVLLITRPGAPDGTFGPVHTLSVNVATDMKKAVEHSALTGLAFGEIPIPVPIDAAVKSRVVSRLQALGYVVCEAPCGEGSLQVLLTESSVNPELTREGPKVNVRLATHFVVHQNDGSTPYDFTFWANGRGRVDEAGEVIAQAAEKVAVLFEQSLVPGMSKGRLPLEDGGELTSGVNHLLSGNLGPERVRTCRGAAAQEPLPRRGQHRAQRRPLGGPMRWGLEARVSPGQGGAPSHQIPKLIQQVRVAHIMLLGQP